jgi:hypothetical protein
MPVQLLSVDAPRHSRAGPSPYCATLGTYFFSFAIFLFQSLGSAIFFATGKPR